MSRATPRVVHLPPPREHRVDDVPRVDGFAVPALLVAVEAFAIVLGAAPLLALALLCVHDCAGGW